MSVKIKESSTSEGNAFEDTIKELLKLEVQVGFQSGGKSLDGTDICDIAAWNELGTDHIISRPFMRNSIDENKDKINSFLQSTKQELLAGAAAEKVLNDIGLFQKDLIQEQISSGNFEPNKESTILRKGSDRPLIDTGRMRQSVNYMVKKKGDRSD